MAILCWAAKNSLRGTMCLWAIYIFPGSVHIFPPAEKADSSWEYIIRSQTHECGNWDWSPDIPFLGISVSNFQLFFFAVQWLCVHHAKNCLVTTVPIACFPPIDVCRAHQLVFTIPIAWCSSGPSIGVYHTNGFASTMPKLLGVHCADCLFLQCQLLDVHHADCWLLKMLIP